MRIRLTSSAIDQTVDSASEGRSPIAVPFGERRRATLVRLTFDADARRLRSLLAEVESSLEHPDPEVKRRVRLLVTAIVARLIETGVSEDTEIAMEVKPDSVRIDVWQNGGVPGEFFEHLDQSVFLDLASAWGRDRRRLLGAWFEIRSKPAD